MQALQLGQLFAVPCSDAMSSPSSGEVVIAPPTPWGRGVHRPHGCAASHANKPNTAFARLTCRFEVHLAARGRTSEQGQVKGVDSQRRPPYKAIAVQDRIILLYMPVIFSD